MLALELQPLRLAAVVSASLLLLLLIPTQAGAQLDVDARRRRESESLGNLDQVKLVHVEDGPERVRGICLEIGSVTFLGGLGGLSQYCIDIVHRSQM